MPTRNPISGAEKDLAAKTVRHHIVRGMLCCAGIPRRNPLFDQSSRVTAGRDIVSGTSESWINDVSVYDISSDIVMRKLHYTILTPSLIF